MSHLPCRLLLLPGLLAALPAIATAQMPAEGSDWQFTVLLDGEPIGQHRFSLSPLRGDSRTLVSEARFEVRLLGFTAYRYQHRAEERWQEGCLARLQARTDDDGQLTTVTGERAGERFVVTARAGNTTPSTATVEAASPTCLMTFAYWHPDLVLQQRLLDPGTGRIEAVNVTPLPATTIEVAGVPRPVRGWRIAGLPRPIDLWYAGSRWVGLDTTVERGRRLSYRLR